MCERCHTERVVPMWMFANAIAQQGTEQDERQTGVYTEIDPNPPVNGTFGTMGRNLFCDTGFKNVDFSVFKNFTFKERYNATFRAEFVNLFNHPTLANPYSFGTGNDPSNGTGFDCGCATPDFAAGNPIVGSGSARDIQLGFKFTF